MKLTTEMRGGVKYVTGASVPKRPKNSHKYNYGCDMIIGGSVGYTGAPYYSAEAASRVGAGLVFLGVPEAIYEIEAIKSRSSIPFPLSCTKSGAMSEGAFDEIAARFPKTDAILIGPGMGRSCGITRLVSNILRSFKGQIIIDADGINAVSENIDILGISERPVIITPHMGEFSRLGGDTRAPMAQAAHEFSAKHRCITVLKGPETVTAFPDGDLFINTSGSPALSKGGSGDVLAGMILGLTGQGFDLKAAVPGAVYFHGRAGDICGELYTEYGVISEDIIEAIPKALSTDR